MKYFTFDFYKRSIYIVLDIVLATLAFIMLIYMIRHLVDLAELVFLPLSAANYALIIDEVVTFFLLFEFVVMLVRYIQDGHHIPIQYLILISMTAILRQLLIIHDHALNTVFLTIALLLLAIVLGLFAFMDKGFKIVDNSGNVNENKKDSDHQF